MAKISRPPGYELFFAPLTVDLNPTELERIHFAYVASKYGHADQKRDDGTRYFDHPKAAAWIYIEELGGRDPRLIILLLLHDVSEDAYLLSPYRITLNFDRDTALDVRALTKLPKTKGRPKETTGEYLARVIKQGPWAIMAKLCDRLHNVRSLGGCTPEKRRAQIAETKQYHLPLLVPALRAHGNPWAEYTDQIAGKLTDALCDVELLE